MLLLKEKSFTKSKGNCTHDSKAQWIDQSCHRPLLNWVDFWDSLNISQCQFDIFNCLCLLNIKITIFEHQHFWFNRVHGISYQSFQWKKMKKKIKWLYLVIHLYNCVQIFGHHRDDDLLVDGHEGRHVDVDGEGEHGPASLTIILIGQSLK